MKVAFTTLGCRTNQHDTAEMRVLLEKEGYSIVNSSETADIYVINTCTVTARSDYNSRLSVKKSLAINANATVIFTGCYAQLNPDDAWAYLMRSLSHRSLGNITQADADKAKACSFDSSEVRKFCVDD